MLRVLIIIATDLESAGSMMMTGWEDDILIFQINRTGNHVAHDMPQRVGFILIAHQRSTAHIQTILIKPTWNKINIATISETE